MKSKNLLKSFIISSCLMASIGANAQMMGSDVFLQGNYVEVGIGKLGYYGSDTAAPAGYHPHCTGCGVSSGIGFVCDYGADGWTVGTPPYMGDYFLPGSPFEGWELQVDTMRCQAFNSGPGSTFTYNGGMPACTGSNISYSSSGSQVIGTWQGTVDSIIITQVTTIDTGALYFTVNVTLTNTAVAPKNNIYYFRTLDPDNDETWPGGAFSTNNKIEHQVADTSVVSATGMSGPYTLMALGTTDTPATAVIYDDWSLAPSVDLGTIFNRTYAPAQYTQGVPDNGDIAIGLVIKIAHLATVDSAIDSVARETAAAHLHPANSASFSYFYAFTTAGMDSAISAGIKAKTPTDTTSALILGIQNANSTSEVKVYPNPAKNIINITGLNTGDQVSMYDMMGRKTDQNWAINGTGVNTFSMNNVPAGAYLVVVTDANGNMKARVPLRKL